jgi:hypothetical protein
MEQPRQRELSHHDTLLVDKFLNALVYFGTAAVAVLLVAFGYLLAASRRSQFLVGTSEIPLRCRIRILTEYECFWSYRMSVKP